MLVCRKSSTFCLKRLERRVCKNPLQARSRDAEGEALAQRSRKGTKEGDCRVTGGIQQFLMLRK